MKPTIELFVGAPIIHGSELAFLKRLYSDLQPYGAALIFANFEVKVGKESRQIDFLVVTPTRSELVELKTLSGRLHGAENGPWMLFDSSGHISNHIEPNPWTQARDAKLAVSDAMHGFAKANSTSVPGPISTRFFKEFGASVCICGILDSKSKVTAGDFKARVYTYESLLGAITKVPIKSNWTIAHWKGFAAFLNLKPCSLASALDPKIAAYENIVSAYLSRLQSISATSEGPLLSAVAGEMCGEPLIEHLLIPENHLLLGNSGLGKTHHVCHLALRAGAEGRIPLRLDTRQYAGDFEGALSKSIAAYTTSLSHELLAAIKSLDLKPLLIVDGLNYCGPDTLSRLLKDLLAFQLANGGNIVATSQHLPDIQSGLILTVTHLAALTMAHKRAIYCYHAGLPISSDVDHLCQGFASAYDLCIAGRCHKQARDWPTRTELYDRYCDQVIQVGNRIVTMAALRQCAALMDEELAYSLSRERFVRGLEAFCNASGLPISFIDELAQCRILKESDHIVYFEHDLLRDYFAADALRMRAAETAILAAELARPKYQAAIQFILPRYQSPREIRELLISVRDEAVLSACLRGEMGQASKTLIEIQCDELFRAATEDLLRIKIEFQSTESNGHPAISRPRIINHHHWSPYEILLCDSISHNLATGERLGQFIDLLCAMESRLRMLTDQAARNANASPQAAWAETLRIGRWINSEVTLPALRMASTLEAASHCSPRIDLPADMVNSLTTLAAGNCDFALLLLLRLIPWLETVNADLCLAMLIRAWNSKISELKLEALHMLYFTGGRICRQYPGKAADIVSALQKMRSNNIWISSAIVEALTALNAIEPLVDLNSAYEEAKEILAATISCHSSEYEVLRERGSSFIGCIFEDVYQNSYYDAYHRLSDREKLQLLLLAAEDTKKFHSDWILHNLVELKLHDALPIFRRFNSPTCGNPSFPQESVAAYILALAGCALFNDDQWDSPTAKCIDETAWKLIGQLLFIVFQDRESDTVRVESLWNQLKSQAPFAVADVLYQIKRSNWLLEHQELRWDLTKIFPKEVGAIFECSLKNKDKLTSIFEHSFSFVAAERTRFMIETLGRIGTSSSIEPLTPFTDDPEHGTAAILAIRAIRARLGQPA